MKKLTALLLTLALLIALAVPAFAFTAVLSAQSLSVNGQTVDCEKYNIDGNNYFKLRDLAQLLNGTLSQFDVGWDEAQKLVSITTNHAYTTPNGHELEIGVDNSATAQVSAQTIMIDGVVRNDLSVYNIGGSNFFKLRELGNALGFNVGYDEASKTMLVTSRGGAVDPDPTPAPAPTPTPGPAEKQELTSEQIYARCMPAVFYIEVYDDYGDAIASGSGFFIDGEGTAVTNHHVIYGATSAKIMLADSAGADTEVRDVLGVYDWSEEEDWAVLKIDGGSESWLTAGESATASGGAKVYALGSPLGLSASISDGIVSNPARLYDGQTYIQITAPISHGSSGGALVNKFGEVVGITSAGFDDGQNLNLAIPIARIANAKHDALTPINETYTMPGGTIYTDYTSVILRPGETFDVEVTTTQYNTDALLTVVPYFQDDWYSDPVRHSDLIDLTYSDWTIGSDTKRYTMHINASDACGETMLLLALYTQDENGEPDVFLNSCTVYVTVVGGTLEPETDDVMLKLGESVTLALSAYADDGRSVYVSPTYDPTIVDLVWGEWNEAQNGLTMTLTGLSCDVALIDLSLCDAETDEVLATAYVYVTVYGGTITIDKTELMMAPGETATVHITGAPNDPNVHAALYADEYESTVIDWQRGYLGEGSYDLKITALEEGWDLIQISLMDDAGNELAWELIDVYVSMDGREPGE